MNRAVYEDLREWLADERRRPLILRGARQVGKTWLVRELARERKLPELPVVAVVAAGSLLEFALADFSHSMPAGRVSYAYVEPLGFPQVEHSRAREFPPLGIPGPGHPAAARPECLNEVPRAQGGAISDRPWLWGANAKRFSRFIGFPWEGRPPAFLIALGPQKRGY